MAVPLWMGYDDYNFLFFAKDKHALNMRPSIAVFNFSLKNDLSRRHESDSSQIVPILNVELSPPGK